MENIETIAFTGSSDLIGNLQLCIDHISYAIPNIMNSVSGQYNVRCVFEKVENQLTFSDSILGELINQEVLGKVYMNDKSDIKSVLFVGVGGQGTILASKILTIGLIGHGYDVKMSEVHGMSQRGGSVSTQVRFGSKVYSPIIGEGSADILVSFEEMEAARYARFLKKDGKMVVNTTQIPSLPVLSGVCQYPRGIVEELKQHVPVWAFDATKVDAIVESEEPISLAPNREPSAIDKQIAEHIFPYLHDGITLQLGIGGMPNALGSLIAGSDLKDLGMHTELMSDGYLDLYRAGKNTNDKKPFQRGKGVFSICMGSKELYEFLDHNQDILSAPMHYVNNPPAR